MVRELEKGYTYEADVVDKDTWHYLLASFDDATFPQTWSYGAAHWGEEALSHLILFYRGRVVGLAQLQTVAVPILKTGIAYVKWGPLWRHREEGRNLNHLRMLARALKREYAVQRCLLVRIEAKEVTGRDDDVRDVFVSEEFGWQPSGLRTMVMDLSPALEELRKRMNRGHRRSLQIAESQNVTIEEGTDDRFMDAALDIYHEMKARKKYVDFIDMEEIIRANRHLPEHLKTRVAICLNERKPIAALGWTPIGKTGQLVIASTRDEALRLKSSFLLWWRAITYFKTNGFDEIDLGGANPEKNPGSFFFKKGLIGDNAELVNYLGLFDAAANIRSVAVFKGADFVRSRYRAARESIERSLRAFRPEAAEKPPLESGKIGLES